MMIRRATGSDSGWQARATVTVAQGFAVPGTRSRGRAAAGGVEQPGRPGLRRRPRPPESLCSPAAGSAQGPPWQWPSLSVTA
jgi:hypothetical protein